MLLAVVMIAALFFDPQLAGTAAAAITGSNAVPVRVGYFSNGDFMHKDADGSYSGYDIEYYYTLAGYADWNLRFVEYDSLQSALAALDRGEIDVMSGLSKTDERKSRYLVSSRKMCTSHIAVQTRADDDRFSAGDTDTMTNLTCGILKASNVVTLYQNWCAENGLTPHVVEYDSLEQRNAALFGGRVDAIAAGSTIEGAQKIAEFPSLDLYFMFNRNRADLKTQLDRAMGILSLQDPTYETNLFNRYFPSSRNTKPSFSAQEKAFIAAHPEIRVALLANDAPFSRRQSDGSVTGILPAYFDHLSEVIGTKFVCVPYANNDAACAALAAGDVDMVGKFRNDIFEADSRKVILSVSYLKMNLVQITRAGTEAVASAAVPACNRSFVTDEVTNAGSPLKLTVCANSEACFDSLKSRGTDAVICTQPAASWLLNRNRATDYVVSAFGSGTWDAACALAAGSEGNTLRSIVNKTVVVDGSYISQLITSDTLEDSADLSSVFDRLSVSSIVTLSAIVIALLAVAVAALLVIVRRRKAEGRLAAQQAALAAEEEASRARHAFFGSVSHDMRTPLNGIVGFTNLALKSDDPAQIRDYLAKIRASGNMLTSLVSDTLVMSRLVNDKYSLTLSQVDTESILSGILEPIQALADEKGVHFVSDTAGLRPRRIKADRLSIQKIVLNLLTNAVKFTPAGGTVTFSCRLEPEEGWQPDTVLTVSDTGIGISEAFLPRIFEPFSQEDAAHAGSSGSGMGLSIVKSIVDAMGGTIQVESEKGRGSTFIVRLHFEEIENQADRAAEPKTDFSVLQGKRVLVCEDNELNLEIIRSILEQAGMEVTGTENGKLGLDVFEASTPGSFDFVLLDLRMPIMDGLETARAIRAMDRVDSRAVPIFAVSADAFAENVEECLAAGMNGHIAKPVDAALLLETLVHSLQV